MKILVVSDSHRMVKNLSRVIDILSEKIQMILFLGDCIEDIIDYEGIYENIEIRYVAGNCDSFYPYPEDLAVEAMGKKIFMTHGHKYGVKVDNDSIIRQARNEKCDICLFGHTHSPDIFHEGNILFMNPGSISLPRGLSPYPTYGIIDIENNQACGKIIAIKNNLFMPFDI